MRHAAIIISAGAVAIAALAGSALAYLEANIVRHVEMRYVEKLLVFHGYPVEGFASTPAPDFALVDAIAPPGCVDVWRVAHLARLAIERRAPARKDESGTIGAAAAIAYAQDLGRLECVP